MKECPEKDKMGRNNGQYIDMPIKNMYNNWILYLQPFINDLEKNITDIECIPLGTKIVSHDKDLNGTII